MGRSIYFLKPSMQTPQIGQSLDASNHGGDNLMILWGAEGRGAGAEAGRAVQGIRSGFQYSAAVSAAVYLSRQN